MLPKLCGTPFGPQIWADTKTRLREKSEATTRRRKGESHNLERAPVTRHKRRFLDMLQLECEWLSDSWIAATNRA